MSKLSGGNRVVHGLWIGPRLSRLELLTLHSFTRHGHQFHLWLYEPLEQELPANVVRQQAAEILPAGAIFRNQAADPASGVGPGSLGAFSDLFRYKLLYEKGGIWVDMDVTCLAPFDVEAPYLFRAHRIGVVGNIMKCPKRSPVMRDSYQESLATIGPGSAWMAANQILTRQVVGHGLGHAVRADLCNEDDWRREVAPLLRAWRQPPDGWRAIHWLNEYWRGLESGRIAESGPDAAMPVPTKDTPPPGGVLYELYRLYGLTDPYEPLSAQMAALPSRTPAISSSARPEPPKPHVNMLIPSLVRGGAERIVLDIAAALQASLVGSARLYVQQASKRQYALPASLLGSVTFLPPNDPDAALRALALGVLNSPSPVIYTHMVPARTLRRLWLWGVLTVPVVHNTATAWQDKPAAFSHDNVPFVVAVSDAIAAELRSAGCAKPVITLRHEIIRNSTPAMMTRQRKDLRDRYGIGAQTLLIGMVGQFKLQKAYTRAVRVLAAMREICDVKLMILGGWDHEYGNGRSAYEATCRLAVELGVIADMIMPGDVNGTEPYFAAFDVFLNTSVHEGLSIAMLEAIAAGCPVVAADAGGNREALPEAAVLVADGADIAGYVQGICGFLQQPARRLPPPPAAPLLVPALWALLARHGVNNPIASKAAPAGTLFVTDNLHVGGAQRSLVNLLTAMPGESKILLAVLGGASMEAYAQKLDEAGVTTMRLGEISDFIGQASALLEIVARLNLRNICLWNAPAAVKLSLAKILLLREIRLIDVSPGPMLFDQMALAEPIQRRLAFDAAAYFERLDAFVAKYEDGFPRLPHALRPAQRSVIPNGVRPPPHLIPLPPPGLLLPAWFEPTLAIGTCCRLVPDKQVEFLLEMIAHLVLEFPRASLTIVGGPESQDSDYYRMIEARVRDEGLDHVRLVGRQDEVNRFLQTFKIFVMVSQRQGCPNASLEAMAMGLPVVSNRSGGVAEQVVDGVTGFLVDTPEEMAARVGELLRHERRRLQFGAAAKARAGTMFSMPQMVRRYQALLDDREPDEVFA